jgi:hypothetical protein
MAAVCSAGNIDSCVARYALPHHFTSLMSNEKPYGFALILGTLAGLVTIANHPTGHALLADFDRIAIINRTIHALAIAGTIATVFGLVGLRRQLEHRSALADAALVSYGFGAVAVMFAAIASGFIGTVLARRVLEAGDVGRAAWDPLLAYNYALNQSSTQVFVVAASIGIVLWSVAMMTTPRFGRALGVTGFVVGAGAATAIVAGLRLDIHGFGAIVVSHGIWLVWTGVRLLKS